MHYVTVTNLEVKEPFLLKIKSSPGILVDCKGLAPEFGALNILILWEDTRQRVVRGNLELQCHHEGGKPENSWGSCHQDRIHLKPTHYAYAQYLEALEDVEGALTHYEYLGFQTTTFGPFWWTGRFWGWCFMNSFMVKSTTRWSIWGTIVFCFVSTSFKQIKFEISKIKEFTTLNGFVQIPFTVGKKTSLCYSGTVILLLYSLTFTVHCQSGADPIFVWTMVVMIPYCWWLCTSQ